MLVYQRVHRWTITTIGFWLDEPPKKMFLAYLNHKECGIKQFWSHQQEFDMVILFIFQIEVCPELGKWHYTMRFWKQVEVMKSNFHCSGDCVMSLAEQLNMTWWTAAWQFSMSPGFSVSCRENQKILYRWSQIGDQAFLLSWKFGGYQFLTDSAPCDSLSRNTSKILHWRQHNLNLGRIWSQIWIYYLLNRPLKDVARISDSWLVPRAHPNTS